MRILCVFPQEGGRGVRCCKGVSWLPQRRGWLGGGGGLWIFFPGPLLDPRMRLACIKESCIQQHLLIKFFLQDFLSTYGNIGYFFTGNIKTPKQSFFVFFSYKFTVKHRVKTSHKIIIMMHYHYNIMIVRTKQNDNFSLLISALQTYND